MNITIREKANATIAEAEECLEQLEKTKAIVLQLAEEKTEFEKNVEALKKEKMVNPPQIIKSLPGKVPASKVADETIRIIESGGKVKFNKQTKKLLHTQYAQGATYGDLVDMVRKNTDNLTMYLAAFQVNLDLFEQILIQKNIVTEEELREAQNQIRIGSVLKAPVKGEVMKDGSKKVESKSKKI